MEAAEPEEDVDLEEADPPLDQVHPKHQEIITTADLG